METPTPFAGRRIIAYTGLFALIIGFASLIWSYPEDALRMVLTAPLMCPPLLLLGLIPSFWRRRGPAPPEAKTDLERRRHVWNALSELYLDTELEEPDNARIAAVLAQSGYSSGQLEEILYRELHPVLLTNLVSFAGEWAGFDPDWLEAQILKRGSKRRGFAVIPGKWMVRRSWRAILAQLPGNR